MLISIMTEINIFLINLLNATIEYVTNHHLFTIKVTVLIIIQKIQLQFNFYYLIFYLLLILEFSERLIW